MSQKGAMWCLIDLLTYHSGGGTFAEKSGSSFISASFVYI